MFRLLLENDGVWRKYWLAECAAGLAWQGLVGIGRDWHGLAGIGRDLQGLVGIGRDWLSKIKKKKKKTLSTKIHLFCFICRHSVLFHSFTLTAESALNSMCCCFYYYI